MLRIECQFPSPFTRCIHAFHCVRMPIKLPKCWHILWALSQATAYFTDISFACPYNYSVVCHHSHVAFMHSTAYECIFSFQNVGMVYGRYHRQLLISSTSLSPCVLPSHVAFMHSTVYECQFSFQNVCLVYGRYHRQLLISPISLSPFRTTMSSPCSIHTLHSCIPLCINANSASKMLAWFMGVITGNC